MTTETLESPPEDLVADDLFEPEGPDEPDSDGVPAGDDFTGDTEPEAPYGWTVDKVTGERRPKRRPGRPKVQPTIEELAANGPIERAEDKPPKPGGRPKPPPSNEDVPQPKAGVIAAGINKVYRRAGRLLKGVDRDLGLAVIECTKADPEDPDGLTVGQAWENLARANPRIRARLLRLIEGGAMWDLVMAHLPIALAVAMKPAIQRVIPFHRFAAAWMEDAEDGDLTAEDLADVAATMDENTLRIAEQMMTPEMRRAAERAMSRMGNGLPPGDDPNLPPQFRRAAQPRHRSRAQRKKAHR